ncbi:MAG: hypothetical protein MJ104_02920 [Lachnospiraceae bacterium]|nr:hypothetical protein [Lachnospiraceae bacterium]
MAQYRADIAPLLKYLPWLREATFASTMTMYKGQDASEGAFSFPVYDATLMSFIKDATASSLMDRNYPYVYTRKHITSAEQERDVIVACDYKSWDTLKGIFSKYVLGGRTKGTLWSQGVSEQIFCLVLEQMNAIVTEWDAERNLEDK